jgi:hypothetical protein
VSDETKATAKVDEPQLAADEVKEEQLKDVSGGGVPMQISPNGATPSTSAINYP